MGKRGARNKNSNQKKKSPNNSENSRAESLNAQTMFRQDPSKRNSDDSVSALRHIHKSFISTMRNRLSNVDEPYKIDNAQMHELKSKVSEHFLSKHATEFIEEIFLLIYEFSQKFSEFLQESYQCIESVCLIYETISGSSSIKNIIKLSYFCKIFKPAWDLNKSIDKNCELRSIFKELQVLSKNFKDHNLLPLENVVHMIDGNESTKILNRILSDLNKNSMSSDQSEDFEIEEFRNRLESFEKISPRKKPLVSEEWINTLKRQLSKIRLF